MNVKSINNISFEGIFTKQVIQKKHEPIQIEGVGHYIDGSTETYKTTFSPFYEIINVYHPFKDEIVSKEVKNLTKKKIVYEYLQGANCNHKRALSICETYIGECLDITEDEYNNLKKAAKKLKEYQQMGPDNIKDSMRFTHIECNDIPVPSSISPETIKEITDNWE